MERLKIEDETVWPNPTGEKFKLLNWRLRNAPGFLKESDLYHAAEIIEAYSAIITHPAFTLKKVCEKVSGIRKAIKRQ